MLLSHITTTNISGILFILKGTLVTLAAWLGGVYIYRMFFCHPLTIKRDSSALFSVFANYYCYPSNKAARGVSGSHARHRGDEWANWGLTVNNWKRWDKCWAPLCATVCSHLSFFHPSSAHPFFSPAMFLFLSPCILILSVSLCWISLLSFL